MPKKKFKDTKVGKFLIGEKGVLDALGESMPDKGLFGLVKNLVSTEPKLTEQDKDVALRLIDIDMQEADGTTNRWIADMKSDNKLSKNARPFILLYLTFMMTLLVILDSTGKIEVKTEWSTLIETTLITVYVSYFGGRSIEKYAKIKGQ